MSVFFSQFLDYKVYNQGIHPLTLKAYKRAFSFLSTHFSNLDDLSIYDNHRLWIDYMARTKERRKWSPVTYNTMRKLYSTFCSWLVLEEIILKNPFSKIPKMKEPKRLPKSYSREQVTSMRSAIAKMYWDLTFLDVRNQALLYVLLYTGIRRNELLDLQIHHVDVLSKTIRIEQWKWGKDRLVPIPDVLYPYIERYTLMRIQCYFWKNTDSFFASKNGSKLTEKNLYAVQKKLEEKTWVDITTHRFRHTFATELIRNNIDVYNVSQILGHSSIRTTQIYLSANMNSIAQSINSASLYQ